MFKKLLIRIATGLKKRQFDYMLIGGQAVLLYGEPRFTKDIDITLAAGAERLHEILQLAKSFRWKVLVKSPASFVKKTMVLPFLDPSGIRIDFIFSFSPYERQAMGRVKKVRLGKTEVSFASLEDLVIHKIIAGRPRDLEDVKSVLLKNPRFDKNYIQRWLHKFEKTMAQPFLKRFEEIRKSH